MSEQVRCPFCESSIPREALFCSRCGGKLPRRDAAPVHLPPVVRPSSPAPTPVATASGLGPGPESTPLPAASADPKRSSAPTLRPPDRSDSSQLSISRFDRARGAPRAMLLALGAVVFLAAGFGLARWLGVGSSEVPVVASPAGQRPVIGLGEPHQVVGAEVPDPGGFLAPSKSGMVARKGTGPLEAPRTSAAKVQGRPQPSPGEPPRAQPDGGAAGGGATSPEPPAPPAPEPPSPPDPAEPDDQPDEPEAPDGQLDTRAVIFVVRHFLPQVRSCYERQLRNEPELRGQVTVRFTIGAGGRVTDAQSVFNSTGSDQLAGCVAATVRTWRFPEPEGGPVAFEYPFRFGGRPAALPGPTEGP
ncbi:MAG: TonB family protein [Deltaproteobacteria bacterium]|nr:TonB family protein [Deltaproteobacteria bacterium]